MLMYSTFLAAFKEAHPQFLTLSRLDELQTPLQAWLISPKCGVATVSDDYELTGNHYCVLDNGKTSMHVLWFEPSSDLIENMLDTKMLHAKFQPFVVGVIAVYSEATRAFMFMDSGALMPVHFNKTKSITTLFSISRSSVSQERMSNAQKLVRTMTQLRLICYEAKTIGFPIVSCGDVHSIGAAVGLGSTALDLVERLKNK